MIKSFMTHGLAAFALATSGLASADISTDDSSNVRFNSAQSHGIHSEVHDYQKSEKRYAANPDILITSRGNVFADSDVHGAVDIDADHR
ncbi:hypothetical protein [Cobetia amphilecti]|uniref:hypothetical protein n=1 Tax=Cobetia amphilecti TaxID=1055104 RepID=UPI0026E352A9|nr:hypothetical protein [Cobetia amphilecti]MDO6816479.1 hypothetical protein [Cobetia amphilecti]